MRRTMSENLCIADSNGREGYYANAFWLSDYIITANHVAEGKPTIIIPGGTAVGRLDFYRHLERDLAVASYMSTQGQNGSDLILSEKSIGDGKKLKGEKVTVKGFFGPRREEFEIQARIVGVDRDNRIIIARNPREQTFQRGMSGCVAVVDKTVVAGFLVAGVDEEGDQAYFEPAWALLQYIAGVRSV